jgi:hypothetical protein
MVLIFSKKGWYIALGKSLAGDDRRFAKQVLPAEQESAFQLS